MAVGVGVRGRAVSAARRAALFIVAIMVVESDVLLKAHTCWTRFPPVPLMPVIPCAGDVSPQFTQILPRARFGKSTWCCWSSSSAAPMSLSGVDEQLGIAPSKEDAL